jgi:hypothetical protein
MYAIKYIDTAFKVDSALTLEPAAAIAIKM